MKRKFNWNVRNTAGLIIGLLTPVICIPLIIWISSLAYNFMFTQLWYKLMHSRSSQSTFLSLSCIPNLLWFYFFINRERYDLAKGIIVGTATFIPYIVYLVYG